MDPHPVIKSCLEKVCRFNDRQLGLLSNVLTKKQLDKKMPLLREGQVCSFVAIILTGSLRAYNPETEQTLCFFTEQDWVADHNSFFNQKPSANVIEAMEPTEVAVLRIQNVHKLIEADPAFLVLGRVMGGWDLSERLNGQNGTPQQRYNSLMKKHPGWIIRFPQKHLASYLGMTPETFSRMKRKTLFS